MKEKHIHAKKLLLFILDELHQDDKAGIAAHLKDCETCTRRLEDQKAIVRQIESYPRLMPAEPLLKFLRLKLRNRLMKPAARKSLTDRFIEFAESLQRPSPVLRWAVSGAFLLIGVFIGRLPFDPQQDQTMNAVVALNSAPVVTNFHVEPSIEKDYHVEIRFSAVQDFILRGDLNNPDIQYALAYALVNDQRDDIRLQTVELLENSEYTESVQSALLHAVERDDNPGVRLKAMRLLKNLPLNESVKQILISALFKDPIAGIQREAADALTRFDSQDVLSALQRKAKDDEYMNFLIQKLSRRTVNATTNKNM